MSRCRFLRTVRVTPISPSPAILSSRVKLRIPDGTSEAILLDNRNRNEPLWTLGCGAIHKD